MRFIYVILGYLLIPVLLGHLLWRSRTNPEYRQRISERFGRGHARLPQPSIWVHAVSVGEIQAAAALVRALLELYPTQPVVLTTVTPTGAQRARELFGDAVVHSYAPFDLVGAVRKFFDWSRPKLLIVLETELWPNLYHECGRRDVPLVLASARVSPKSVNRYRWMLSLFRQTLSHGIVIAAQSEADAKRFLALGADPQRTNVTGNIKFDFNLPADIEIDGAQFRQSHAPDRPVWIAASTHASEEEIVLAAHRQVLDAFPNALLLMVPRHPERFQTVTSLTVKQGFSAVRRSTGDDCTMDTEVFIGDSMGELPVFYAAADIAFVGGSLVQVGGHNLLEPAALGKPVLTGPYTYNAEDIARLLQDAGAARIVTDADELGEAVINLLGDAGERLRLGTLGRGVVDSNRGALDRLLTLIAPFVDQNAGAK
ncbi:MAG: lipid IV(A) 3-deoxy-D-manno-octulosonic acid transferase [Gammaproteobacteria bacterium]